MILVTGATGTTGSEVVRQLAAADAPVRALVRNPERWEAIKAPGVEIAVGDLGKPDTLDDALRGVEKVFLLVPLEPGMLELQDNLVEVAKRAGVGHIVRMSAFGADAGSTVSIRRLHGRSDERLERSGVPSTVLRPHFFMQNFLGYAPSIAGAGSFYAPMGEGRIGLIDVRDIAAVAVRALTEPGHEGKTYVLTGPESLSFGEIAEKLSVATGKEVTYVDVPSAAARQGMVDAGLPEWLADVLVELYAVFAAGEGDAVTTVVADVAKKEPRTFDSFAADFAHLFKGA